MDKVADTGRAIHALLAKRWSPRAFDASAVVAVETQEALIEAARWSPSCFGAQPWFFVVVDKHAGADGSAPPQRWERALECLVEGNRVWAQHASLLVFVCANTHFDNGKENRFCAYDCGAAAMALVLEAENQGLRAHQMAGFSADAARAVFDVPDSRVCLSVIAVGRQVAADALPSDLAERERAPRTRKGVGEVCDFLG